MWSFIAVRGNLPQQLQGTHKNVKAGTRLQRLQVLYTIHNGKSRWRAWSSLFWKITTAVGREHMGEETRQEVTATEARGNRTEHRQQL
jgi:hypothetical protein